MADITPIASLNGELAMPEKVWMQGPPGPQGQQGEPGAAATVTVGAVTTGEPGTDAIVENSGTESAAVLNFTIPKGDTGATGPAGADGVSPTVSTSKSGNVTTITIVDASGTKTATINDGSKGDTGPAGPAGAGVPDGGTVGQLLSKTESGTAWIDPPQSGGGVLIVNITNGTENGSLVADKTVAEIIAAAHTQLVFAQYSVADTSGNGTTRVIAGPLARIQTEIENGEEFSAVYFAGYWYDSKESMVVGGITGTSFDGVDHWSYYK